MAKKVYKESNIKAIADKIREKTGGEETYKTNEMPGGIDAVYETGQKAEYDRFWDVYQQNGNRKSYDHAFAGAGWTAETFKPKHDIKLTSGYMMFRYMPLEVDMVEWLNELGVTFDDSNNGNCGYMYFNCGFTRIGTTTIKNQAGDLFAYCPNLHTIDKIVCTQNTTFGPSTFRDCTNLANVTFEGVIASDLSFRYCPNLTHDSLMSIINALKDFRSYSKTYTLKEYEWQGDAGDGNFNQNYSYDGGYLSEDENRLELYSYDNNMETPLIFSGILNEAITQEEYDKIISFALNSDGTLTITFRQETTTNKTLTLHADAKARLTEDELKIATKKGWSLA